MIKYPTTTPPAIICIGRNYADHAAEMNAKTDEHPLIFMKNPASVIGNGESIVIPSICDHPHPQVDYEGELAVIIGKNCKDVSEADSLDYLSGYAVANDVSARWWQKKGSGGQFVRGKSFDTFCPISESVPADSVDNPQNLQLVTRLNGEVMQNANTSAMMFSVAVLIAELSKGTTLLEGTVILTGTPSGVGAARTPPRFLEAGDVIEISIEQVGVLTNPVIHE